jgi:hypothetical protein
MNYTVKYDVDRENQFGKIHFDDQVVIMDLDDLFSIVNHSKTFTRYTPDRQFPYYIYNRQTIDYRDFLYKLRDTNIDYAFKNGDTFDLRRSNVDIFHKYHPTVVQQFGPNVVSYHPGHVTTVGIDANIMKNPMWRINENGTEHILMYCEPDTICKLCPISYQKILDFENNNKKLSFYKHSTGYIYCPNNLSVHQIITGCHGNGKGTKNISVDHIDQDPLNNTYANLRIATRKEQEQNSNGIKVGTKRARSKSVRPLPEGVVHDMVKKYVYYAEDVYGKENKVRGFFRVCHPKLDKEMASSKSCKISMLEKLAHANKIADDLEQDIYPVSDRTMPLYIREQESRGKPHLIFDRRVVDGPRQNLRMVLPEDYVLDEQLSIFGGKIKKKYDYDVCASE